MMKPVHDVGIVGHGAYIPRFRLPATEVSRVWSAGCAQLPIKEKSIPGLDEDVVTMSIEAARNALGRARVDPSRIGAVWVGSESHPYAVKPTSSIVAEAIGAVPYTLAADWQFACKAGTEALTGAFGMVGSGSIEYALAVGMDASQARPGDALEYTVGAGGAAFLVGAADHAVAVLEGSVSFVSDTPDFWRRAHALYPEHGGRFTGEPGYFKHVETAARELMNALGAHPRDYAAVVFHQPNQKFPSKAARDLGFSREQTATGMLVDMMGNAYAGSSMLGLSAVLDQARPGDRVLLVSFGSGAGSDAFSFLVTENIQHAPCRIPTTRQYLARRVPLDYGKYARFRELYARV